jgi:hypothetical protein
MRSRMVIYLIQITVVFLLSGCTNSQATVKYQPGDKNVEAGQSLQWTFDSDRVGGLPIGAQVFSGNWAVRAESDTPSLPYALCQTGTDLYPALSLSDKIFTDVVVSTRFKPVSGSTDRAAGIIFRIQDKDNYYILRANALEDNVIVFKYVGGRRSEIKEGLFKVPSGKWQELRVEVKENTIRGYLGDNLVVETHDNTFKAGKIGLWTKADSVTCFDNVKATAK